MTEKVKGSVSWLYSKRMPVLLWLVFSLVFFVNSQGIIPRETISKQIILELFTKYSVYTGLLFGLISMLIAYLLFLLKKLPKLGQSKLLYPVIMMLAVAPWYFLGRQLVYFENRYTDFAKATIDFLGTPLLASSKFMFLLALLWIVIFLILKNKHLLGLGKSVLVLFMIMCLGGCIGEFEIFACYLLPDSDHCYQDAAVQTGDSADCAKIKGADFAAGGSNPPRDKCYLRIAENTGDLSACDQIEGGLMSYTKEECLLGASVKHNNPSGCKELTGSARQQCINAVGPNIEAGQVLEVDEQIKVLEAELANSPDEGLQAQLDGLKVKRQDMLDVLPGSTKSEYQELSDPNYQRIVGDYVTGDLDQKSRDELVDLTRSLREKGEELDDKQYQALRDYLKAKNDPANDIENMDDAEIVQARWNEKMGMAFEKVKFWKANPSEAEQKLDQQLLFYNRMLERQAAILKAQSAAEQDLQRNAGIFGDAITSEIKDKIQGEAIKYIFGEIAEGTAGYATKVLGEALDTVKAEAQGKEFRGLVRAYNLGMEEELAKAGGNVDKAHAAVLKNLESDPYTYEDQNTFAKYGNLIENKNCDGSNPHCIDHDVFWKSMKKSYKYQQKG
ncbi:MAG: hypothetical protein PHU71_03705 [Candidatus Gracilibacteria bacterium]|nr:hypothetical protein [Candidatus Gracilibacteria bacterium]